MDVCACGHLLESKILLLGWLVIHRLVLHKNAYLLTKHLLAGIIWLVYELACNVHTCVYTQQMVIAQQTVHVIDVSLWLFVTVCYKF